MQRALTVRTATERTRAPLRRGREARAGFRADIQGLRALGVGLVVLYHAGLPIFPGGYVGVDVFFVISGFLITGHLASAIDADGRVRFVRFYARRALRILPAAFAVVIMTALALVVFAPIPDLPRVLRDARAAVLYYPNVRFADMRTDYLADHAPSPFQHYWSLGVEEQFYLLWPLVIMAMVVIVRRRWATVTVAVGAVALASFAWGIWTIRVNQPEAFFLLPGRAWELLVGGLVALWARQGALAHLQASARNALGWVGFAVVLGAALLYDGDTVFPGVAALAPVLGTAAVIAAGTGGAVAGLAPVLAAPASQHLGRISYSLYLVHWPLVLVPQVAVGFHRPLPMWVTALLGVVVAVPLASALNRFIEEPMRAPRAFVVRPVRTLAAFAALTGLIAGALTVAIAWGERREVPTAGPAPARPAEPIDPPPASAALPSNLSPSLDAAAASLPIMYSDGCMHSVEDVAVQDCVYGDREGSTVIALFGDSHAAQWFPALRKFAEERGDTAVSTFTKTSCPAPSVGVLNNGIPYETCDRWRGAVVDALVANPPDLVVMSSYAHYDLAKVDAPDRADAWATGLAATVERLRAAGAEVLVIADTPRFLAAPPTCAAQFPADLIGCAVDRTEGFDEAWTDVEARTAREAGAHTADLTPFLCDDQRCPIVFDDLLVYRDIHHLTVEAVEYLSPRLADSIAGALD